MKKELISVAFCPPTGEWEGGYPSRLTDEVFQRLKEAGINRIAAFGMDNREETQKKTFALCRKYGIGYLPCVPSAGEYVRIFPEKEGGKPWQQLTDEEKAMLDERFLSEIAQFVDEPAFKGIFFIDESGYLAFDGIAHAKNVFDKKYPEYEFHVNFFSYSINEKIFWGGMSFDGKDKVMQEIVPPFPLTGDLAIKFENRFHFYDVLVEHLLSQAKFDYISQDKYPFENFWPSVPTSVHVALFELNAFLKQKSEKYRCQFYNYMQVGNWDTLSRKLTYAEMALQMNVTLAYGGSGFGMFPAVFPLDWKGFDESICKGGAGLIDLYGEPTKYAQIAKELNDFYLLFAEDLLNSEFLGITAYGEYENGFDKETIQSLPDSECIYVGNLPDMCRFGDKRIQVKASNQVSLSTFEKDGKRRYLAVNLSSVYDNEISLTLPRRSYELITMDGIKRTDEKINLTLKAGCAIYIQEK